MIVRGQTTLDPGGKDGHPFDQPSQSCPDPEMGRTAQHDTARHGTHTHSTGPTHGTNTHCVFDTSKRANVYLHLRTRDCVIASGDNVFNKRQENKQGHPRTQLSSDETRPRRVQTHAARYAPMYTQCTRAFSTITTSRQTKNYHKHYVLVYAEHIFFICPGRVYICTHASTRTECSQM